MHTATSGPESALSLPNSSASLSNAFRLAMRSHPAGVTVITMNSAAGPVGFTASSFASVSLDPPLVSFNISNRSSCLSVIRETESVLIHILGDDQCHLAQRFSGTASGRFSDHSTWSQLKTGEPLLAGIRIWLRATIDRRITAGDHTLILARVQHVGRHSVLKRPHTPLVYHDGRYHRTQAL